MGKSLLVDASVNNAQNVMQNVCTIVANTPFADDADKPFVPFIENAIINKEPDANDTNEDNEVEFFPTDPHLFRTGTIIEENGFLFKERERDGLIFYDSLEVLNDPDKTLDIIKDSDQYWTTCSGAPSLTPIIGFVDTESNTDYLNDLSVF
jgi:hypothetical protein